MTMAQRTKPAHRQWLCLSEIADECARTGNPPKIDPASRELIINRLREAVLRGDFENEGGKSRLAFLHPSPNSTLRFERVWAENQVWWNKWTTFRPGDWDTWTQTKPWPVTIWMKSADCRAWLKKTGTP
jgi:hypothetical protein